MNFIPKLFVKIIEPKLMHLFSNDLISEQHSFCRVKSTVTNNLVFYSYLVNIVLSGGQVDAIYTNLQKTFDKVDHGLLLLKLYKLGVRDPLLSWFSSYLSGRSKLVKIYNSFSRTIKVTSGVSQGSNLSLLLFYLFINDPNNCVKSSKFLL
jgi:hypothetical protein